MSTFETKLLWVLLTHKCNVYISRIYLLVWCECDFAIDCVVSFEHWATRQVVQAKVNFWVPHFKDLKR